MFEWHASLKIHLLREDRVVFGLRRPWRNSTGFPTSPGVAGDFKPDFAELNGICDDTFICKDVGVVIDVRVWCVMSWVAGCGRVPREIVFGGKVENHEISTVESFEQEETPETSSAFFFF